MKIRIFVINAVYQIPLLLIFYLTISCEKLPDDLKDTSTTGKWSTFNTSTGLTGNQVRGTFCDSKGDMWFAVSSNGAAKYSKGTEMNLDFIVARFWTMNGKSGITLSMESSDKDD